MYYKTRHLFVVYIQGVTWDYYILLNTLFSIETSKKNFIHYSCKSESSPYLHTSRFLFTLDTIPVNLFLDVFYWSVDIGTYVIERFKVLTQMSTPNDILSAFIQISLFFLSSLSQAWWLSIVTHYHSLDLIKVVSICICSSYVYKDRNCGMEWTNIIESSDKRKKKRN